jgi:amyloid beta precursor protein binding protein 1
MCSSDRINSEADARTVVDTHPDTTHTLRIDQTFAALERYARELDLNNMDSMEHSHVPWVVLLVRAGCEWKDAVSLVSQFE